MESCRVLIFTLSVLLLLLFPEIYGWGADGHLTVCRIAQAGIFHFISLCSEFFIIYNLVICVGKQSRLSKPATDAVKELLPEYAENDLGSLCIWADHVKFRYHWSSALHFIDTPDNLCGYQYQSKYNINLSFNLPSKRIVLDMSNDLLTHNGMEFKYLQDLL